MNPNNLSDEQLAGQRLMVGFEGSRFRPELKELIDTFHVGGIILFSTNVAAPREMEELCRSMQAYSLECGQPPLFIAIDQEGGCVARLKEPFTQFPGNPSMRGREDAVYFAETAAKELRSVGINMNMAPVMDMPPHGFKSVMDDRVFGSEPDRVIGLGSTIIDRLQQDGVMAVAKHFPGIGRTTLDSHIDKPLLDTAFHDLASHDLLPFAAAVKHDVAGIMLSHICYTALDPVWPASLSEKIASELLRNQMGYNGLVLTDDLDMGAIRNYHDIETCISRIFLADVDIALICHEGPDIEKAFVALLNLIKASSENRFKAIRSADRILKAKKRYLQTV